MKFSCYNKYNCFAKNSYILSLLLLILLAITFNVSSHMNATQKETNDFSDLVMAVQRWCAKAQSLGVTTNDAGDSLASRCGALQTLVGLAKANAAAGNFTNEWQIKCEFWQQVHDLQFLAITLAMGKDYSVVNDEVYGLSLQLRPLLAALKTYLLKHLTLHYQERITNASERFNEQLKVLVEPKDECSINSTGNHCFMSMAGKEIRGFGAAMIALADCLAKTLEEGKKVVLDPEDFWLMSFAFQSPVGCQDMKSTERIEPHLPNHLNSSLQFLRQHFKPTFFPHPEVEIAWYNGIITDYMIRPQENIRIRAKKRRSEWNLSGSEPFAGVHIRAGLDKLRQSLPHPIEKYMIEVEEWFAVEEIRRNQTLRRLVYIATDGSLTLINEIQTKFPHFTLFYDYDVMISAQSKVPNNTKIENLPEVIRQLDDHHNYKNQDTIINMYLDLESLLQADFFVGTMTSCFSRLVYKIRMGRDPLGNFFNSVFIDKEFLFQDFTYPFSYVVAEAQHHSQQNDSGQHPGLACLDMEVGDKLKLYKYIHRPEPLHLLPLRIGFIPGRLERSGKEGMFYKHKVLIDHWLN